MYELGLKPTVGLPAQATIYLCYQTCSIYGPPSQLSAKYAEGIVNRPNARLKCPITQDFKPELSTMGAAYYALKPQAFVSNIGLCQNSCQEHTRFAPLNDVDLQGFRRVCHNSHHPCAPYLFLNITSVEDSRLAKKA